MKKETATISAIIHLNGGRVEVRFKGKVRNTVIKKNRLGNWKEGMEVPLKKGKPIF